MSPKSRKVRAQRRMTTYRAERTHARNAALRVLNRMLDGWVNRPNLAEEILNWPMATGMGYFRMGVPTLYPEAK